MKIMINALAVGSLIILPMIVLRSTLLWQSTTQERKSLVSAKDFPICMKEAKKKKRK